MKNNNNPPHQKIVITYGTFDLFHIGHERLLRRAKGDNNYLIVGVATDEYNKEKEKYTTIQNEFERFNVIASLDYVDKVIFEKNVVPQWIDDYKKYNVDEIVMGSDHDGELNFLQTKYNLNLRFLERTKNISSTEIKNNLQKSKVILTYGTFDLFHFGHGNFLRRAKALGDILVVGVSTDEFNLLKNKNAHQDFKTRISNLRDSRHVDIIFSEENWEQKLLDIKKYGVNTFVIGDDWKNKFDFLENHGVEVIYLPRTKGISSTKLRNQIAKNQFPLPEIVINYSNEEPKLN